MRLQVTKLERNTIGSVATLQECFDKLGRYGSCTLSRRAIQMAPIRTGSHPACGRVVPAFLTVLPRRRRTLVPELFPAIKVAVDRRRESGGFLVTGSANVMLLPKLSESLAGRIEEHSRESHYLGANRSPFEPSLSLPRL